MPIALTLTQINNLIRWLLFRLVLQVEDNGTVSSITLVLAHPMAFYQKGHWWYPLIEVSRQEKNCIVQLYIF